MRARSLFLERELESGQMQKDVLLRSLHHLVARAAQSQHGVVHVDGCLQIKHAEERAHTHLPHWSSCVFVSFVCIRCRVR